MMNIHNNQCSLLLNLKRHIKKTIGLINQCCQVRGFPTELGYFNTVVTGCFSCPRVEATPITWYLAPGITKFTNLKLIKNIPTTNVVRFVSMNSLMIFNFFCESKTYGATASDSYEPDLLLNRLLKTFRFNKSLNEWNLEWLLNLIHLTNGILLLFINVNMLWEAFRTSHL